MAGLYEHRERQELAQLVRRRAAGAKQMAATRAAELRAEFEEQLAAEYAYDSDEVWAEAERMAEEVVKEADRRIAERAATLGIPARFAPSMSVHWWSRGENAVKERRTELRKVAETRIAAMERAAKVKIEQESLVLQTRLLAEGLESEAAKAFLESMPTPEQLMPSLSMAEVQKQLR